MKSVIPRKKEPSIFQNYELSTNGFTFGKSYPVVKTEGSGGVVMNDNGHERFVMFDGSPSAHITHLSKFALYGPSQSVQGFF